MSSHLIDYEALAEEAARGIVRGVLARVAREGLPGEHHFYISFGTNAPVGAPGVKLSKRLRSQYPEEMTIVLQHSFWDLVVLDDRFEVRLSFNNISEKVVVPFAALKSFFDPSVPFVLSFAAQRSDAQGRGAVSPSAGAVGGSVPVIALVSDGPDAAKAASAPDGDEDAPADEPVVALVCSEGGEGSEGDECESGPEAAAPAGHVDDTSGDGEPAEDAESTEGAEIVELDAFRKKS